MTKHYPVNTRHLRTSSDYLQEAYIEIGEVNDAKTAEKLKISKQALSQYLNGERIMDDFACIMVAKVLKIDAMEVIAAAQMEREKNEERKAIWEDFRVKLGVTLGSAVLGLTMILGSLIPNNANAYLGMTNATCGAVTTCHLYIMSNQGG